MNKKVLLLTLVLASSTLVGCGKNNPSSAPSSAKPVDNGIPTSMMIPEAGDDQETVTPGITYPDELLVNHRICSVLVDEEYQLSAIDVFNYAPNLSFTSKDEGIATVDENGLIKGIAKGETEIVVADKDNPEFSTTVPVYVSPSITAAKAEELVAAFNGVDESGLTRIVDNEMYEKSIYRVDGEEQILLSYERFDERLTVSKDDAYLRIWETDCEIRVKDGSRNFTNYDWIFYTNPFYDTYVYHQVGDVKTYFPVATQSYMDKDRTEPLLAILDNLFVSGSGVFDNAFRNAKLSDFTDMVTSDYNNVTDKFVGSNGDGNMIFGCVVHFDDETADQDTESRYGIPYGTPTPASQGMRYTVKNNKVIALAIHLEETYTIDGVDYLEVYDIDHKFEDFTNDSLFVPNKKDYTLVDSLFSI